MEEKNKLATNSLAFIALSNEFCHAIENPLDFERNDFVATMLKILPRIYIAASDISVEQEDQNFYVDTYLDEESYDAIRDNISRLMEDEDIYLEVFMEDMKYSDTPIGTSVSENLADIYQALYNFVAAVKDSPNESANEIIAICKADFDTYWGQTLCNVLRALHSIHYNADIE